MSHALDVLEFDRVLEDVASRTVSEAGADLVRRLRPASSADRASRHLDAVREIRGAVAGSDAGALGPIPSLEGALSRLGVDGSRLEAEQLRACAVAMSTARSARTFRDLVSPEGLAGEHLERLWGDPALEKRIVGTFEDDGQVCDRASPELRRIRRALVSGRADLVRRLDRFVAQLPDRVRVADASVTVRNGRYCIPVRREGKGAVGGLVHDASASRQTLFVEPTVAIDAMNDIRELELAEAREIDRILRALSDELRAHRRELADSYSALARLDALWAQASFAAELGGEPPTFVEGGGGGIRISGGRHPLLARSEGGAVPFDLELDVAERVLLVSGPNAGGKTVLLKSIGLLVALAQSGIIPPVGAGTRFPFFRRLFAVIGDEQSIDASLSTFGAQASNLAEILTEAGPEDLVLIDEIGSATDPAEGGALAAATLSALSSQVRLTIATTHLGDLKRLGDEDRGTVNASLEFDGKRLEPTYRLVRDRPGRSYALVIAARLGIPDAVVKDARDRLDADHRSLDDLLERVEAERVEAEALRADWTIRTQALERREAEVAERETALEGRERGAVRQREREKRELLKEARQEVEETIRTLEARYAGADAAGRAAARREARGAVERSIRASGEALAEVEPEVASKEPGGTPSAGDRVRWGPSGKSGILVEVRGGRGVVEVDGLRLSTPLGELRHHAGAEAAAGRDVGGPRPGSSDERRPEIRATTEVDLRGLRVDEVEGVLVPALDAAFVAEVPSLRIIHGKGTGALRQTVQALLDADPRAPSFRPGGAGEGGAGVTVVELS